MMAPRRRSLPLTSVNVGGSSHTVRPRLAVKYVKLKPDQYSTDQYFPDQYSSKIQDITRVGRKVGKVIRLKKEEMIKYEKVKHEHDSSTGMMSKPSKQEKELEEESSMPGEVIRNQINANSEEDGLKKDMNDNEEIENNVENDNCDDSLGLVLSDSENSDVSLGLVIADSDDDDYDARENDTDCNLMEEFKIPRRILLGKSSKRNEKLKFGFSKFEFKNDTLNLDRFFTFKPIKVKSRRRRISTSDVSKESGVPGDFDRSAAFKVVLIDEEPNVDDEYAEVLIDGKQNIDNKSAEVLIDNDPNVDDEKSADMFNDEEPDESADLVGSAAYRINKEPSVDHEYAEVFKDTEPNVYIVIDEVLIEEKPTVNNESAEDEPHGLIVKENVLRIVAQDPVQLKSVVEEILEEVFSKVIPDVCTSTSDGYPSKEETKSGGENSKSFVLAANKISSSGVGEAHVVSKSDCSKDLVETVFLASSITEMVDKSVKTEKAEPPSSTARTNPIASKLTSLPAAFILHSYCIPVLSAPPVSELVSESLLSNVQELKGQTSSKTELNKLNSAVSIENKDLKNRPSLNTDPKDLNYSNTDSIPDLPSHPPPTDPQDTLSELLTPSCVQLQSYLSRAKVPELDMEMLARLDSSPEVIITEVPRVFMDSENNVIDEEKIDIKQLKVMDDSDSDVVLLSDDETELYSPTTTTMPSIISSWQSDILSQTWQAWPVPTQAILFHLGLETGLEDNTIRDWFRKRTDQELERLWGELYGT